MKQNRSSYIPNFNTKMNVTWPLVTLVSFLIIIILIVLFLISHFDSINTLINYAQIENKTKELNVEYQNALMQTEDVNKDLLKLKEELVVLNETEGTKLNFYNEMKTISNIKNDFANNIYSSLDTRNILKNNSEQIFLNDNKLSILCSYLFDDNTSEIVKNTNDFYNILAKRLYELLQNETYKKYINCVTINCYTNSNPSETEINLSLERGIKFKNNLINASNDLKNNFSSKFKVIAMEDSNLIYTKSSEDKNNNRIEIDIELNEKNIFDGINKFCN